MPVQSNIFVVNRYEDVPDGNPGDGNCRGQGMNHGDCTLRAAIIEANFSVGGDVIYLPEGAILKLTLEGENENLAFTGDLDIHGSITLKNAGAGFIIDGNGTDRIFHVLSHAELSLQNGTLTNGIANTVSSYKGGAILVENSSSAKVNNIKLVNNVALHGWLLNNPKKIFQ